MAKTAKSITLKEAVEFINRRANAIEHSCNAAYTGVVLNQIRSVIWLFTGEDPGTNFDNIKEIYDLLGVPYHIEDKEDGVYVAHEL